MSDPEIWPFTKVVPYIRLDSTVGPTIAYVVHHYGQDDAGSLARDVLHQIDLTRYGVPAAAVAIEIRAKLVITNSNPHVIADLRGYIGKPSDPLIASWEIHAISAPSNGTRQSQSGSVPVSNGRLTFRWDATIDAQISYGMDVMMTGYYLPSE